MQKLTRKLGYLLFFSFVVWSLVPMLRLSLSMDTQEAIVWGKYCLWGTTKHPPFSGWVAYAWYALFGHSDKAMYALSQIFVTLGVVYIYKLARCFLDKTQAILAAALQFGIIYYGYSTPEFNVNVISVGLWPMCAYYFWRGYTQNKWRDWLLFGVLVGLNLLNKYVGAMLLIALGFFVISDRKVIKLIKNFKVYFAAAAAILLLAPHVWWLWQNDFEAFKYISQRNHGGSISSFWGHIVYPLKFLGAQVLFAAPALLTFAWFRHRNENDEIAREGEKSRFICCTALIPAAMFALICLVSGNAAKSMWGFPCLFMWGTALFYFLPFKIDEKIASRFLNVMFVWVTLFALAYGAQCLVTTSQRYRTDVQAMARMFELKWAKKTDMPLKYVAADVWFGDIMALYASHEIKPMIWMSPKNNPWFSQADFEQSGALLIATDGGEYANYRARYGAAVSTPQKMTLEFKNYFGKTKTKEILYGCYMPWEVENAAEK
ncbi:MAG: glycosyltransferase family 39 protein [Alphaproteobacteria bacterium]|nr:glycosyltransferase family 39 protein [Alphaproteobacteria bacterium]